jgi:hypothetical protein
MMDKVKDAMRLENICLGALGTLKHQAAVLPAIYRERNVIPEKAVEEWPEGKDFLPLMIADSFLFQKKKKQ